MRPQGSNRIPYKLYPITLRTHKLTISLHAAPSQTIGALKVDALSALTSGLLPTDMDVPEISRVDDFEICREVKVKGKQPSTSSSSTYEVLDHEDAVQKVSQPWDKLFIRFRDEYGTICSHLALSRS